MLFNAHPCNLNPFIHPPTHIWAPKHILLPAWVAPNGRQVDRISSGLLDYNKQNGGEAIDDILLASLHSTPKTKSCACGVSVVARFLPELLPKLDGHREHATILLRQLGTYVEDY